MDRLAANLDSLSRAADDLVLVGKTVTNPASQALSLSPDAQASTKAAHTVEVLWPAQPGIIKSSLQNPVAAVGLADGTHTFTLTVDGQERLLSLDVVNGSVPQSQLLLGDLAQPVSETNEEVLQRLARVINGADSRVHAEVEYSYQDAYMSTQSTRPLNRMARLKVWGTGEGQGVDFSLADQDGSLISTYGLDSKTPSRPARVRVEGVLSDQPSNALSLDDGHLTGQMLDSTSGPVDIRVSQGSTSFTQELGTAVAQYNDLVSYLDSHADLLRPSLKDRITRPLEERARRLSGLGLSPTAQGRVTPTGLFSQKVGSGFSQVRQALWGSQGWLSALRVKLGQIQGMDASDFAAELETDTYLNQSRRAWEALGMLTQNIISGYY